MGQRKVSRRDACGFNGKVARGRFLFQKSERAQGGAREHGDTALLSVPSPVRFRLFHRHWSETEPTGRWPQEKRGDGAVEVSRPQTFTLPLVQSELAASSLTETSDTDGTGRRFWFTTHVSAENQPPNPPRHTVHLDSCVRCRRRVPCCSLWCSAFSALVLLNDPAENQMN